MEIACVFVCVRVKEMAACSYIEEFCRSLSKVVDH